MNHNTHSYFIEKVVPSYITFVDYYNEREFGSRKDTFNAGHASESLRDLPEHIFADIGINTGFKNPYKFREFMSDNNKHYKIVCDFANVIKHCEITKNNPSFTTLNAIKESVASVRYSDIIGKYYRTRKLLEVALTDGSNYDVSDLLRESITYWSNKLLDLGLIPNMPKLPEPLPKFAKRNDARFRVDIKMQGFVNEEFEAQLRALIYRKASNEIAELTPGEKFGKSNIPITIKADPSPFE